MYSFGTNSYGQCGVPETQEQLSIPHLIRGIPGKITKVHNVSSCTTSLYYTCAYVQVCCGLDHSLFLTSEGKVYTCGWSADGQTGTPSSPLLSSPPLPTSSPCSPAGIGHYESCAQPTEVRGVISRCKVSSIHTCADSSFALTGKQAILKLFQRLL